MFNWNIPESFDVALHLGTLLAITLFFFKDWLGLIKGGYDQVVKKKKSTEGKIFWYIVAVTIPTGILSLVLDKFSEYICDKFNIESIMIAIALIVLGIVLYIVDKKAPSETKYEDIWDTSDENIKEASKSLLEILEDNEKKIDLYSSFKI